MTKPFATYGTALLLLSAFSAQAKLPSPSHQLLTTHLDNAVTWATHLRDEAKKGKKMNREHVQQEIQGIRDALSSMRQDIALLAQESPGDVKEGHFVALKSHQQKAEAITSEFEAAFAAPDAQFSKMKNAARQIVSELKSAKHEHDLELYEIEQHPGQ